MIPRSLDTIVAPATPTNGPAIRAIVRISGDNAFALADAIAVDGVMMPHASAVDRTLRLGDRIDVPVTCYAFRAPRSSTGEDVVELHLPGSPLLVRLALARLFEQGARLAEPGEFTARAFFHGKLDLARAEGVAATIAAANRRELDGARQLLGGALARGLTPIIDALASLLALVEVGIDFADEAVDFLPDDLICRRIDAIGSDLSTLASSATRLERLAHEPRLVLTGRPNAGKSTLLNALAGTDRAIVSNIAGTTRDALSARVRLRRGFVTLVDTAGLDAAAAVDAIGRQMRDVAVDEIATADAVIRVVAVNSTEAGDRVPSRGNLVVYTKADLGCRDDAENGMRVSALTGENIDGLRERLDTIAFGDSADDAGSATLALNGRHVAAIEASIAALARARAAVADGNEFVASALREALNDIGSITGVISADELLGRIFGVFCIGK